MLNDTEKLPPSSNPLWPSNEDWQKIEAAKQAALQDLRNRIMAKVTDGGVGWGSEQSPPYDLPFYRHCENCFNPGVFPPTEDWPLTLQIRSVKSDNSTAGYVCLDCGFMNKP